MLACDPGLTGAFAAWTAARLTVVDMATHKEHAGTRNVLRDFLDRPRIIDTLRMFWALGEDTLIIEKVGGIPGQAAHSAFTFGHGTGGITYAAQTIGFRIEEVAPARWKSAMKVSADKAKACERATVLLPAYANLWAAVRGNGSLEQRSGRAEASMMALYGEQTLGALAA